MIQADGRKTRTAKALLVTVALAAVFFVSGTAARSSGFQNSAMAATGRREEILVYIHKAWHALQRSMNDCSSFADEKIASTRQIALYLPQGARIPAAEALAGRCHMRVEHLPKIITRIGDVRPTQLAAPSLLYLPNAYVVPGGRFNEMYGWDSYFIIRGLLEDGERDLARNIIENFFYEIKNYGAVLNANRTYYLTRSQPPFLTSMILAQYAADKAEGGDRRQWLARAYEFARRDHAMWTRAPKLAGRTGLSRYFDVGEGPVPETADDPDYYARVAQWLVEHPQADPGYLAANVGAGAGPELRVAACGHQPCTSFRNVRLTADYYKGDRAMRESGFDVSFRFGPFGGSTHHFAPVCLNSLLYKAEMDLAEMAGLVGMAAEEKQWRATAERRKQQINRYLWNSSKGMFFDYDFRTRLQSSYAYLSTFYPLWTGLATAEQAKAVVQNLATFESAGGLAMSAQETGVQWDKPYGWAPLQMIAIEGARRYGFNAEADRASKKFLGTVLANFRRDGTIREKYNVLTRTADVNLTAGYSSNVVGFGWTNAAFVVLLHALPAEDQKALLAKISIPPSSPCSGFDRGDLFTRNHRGTVATSITRCGPPG